MAPLISMSEVKKHTNAKSTWVVIHNDVYDLTKFLDEHPGGADTLLEVAGQDGTQGFEDVQHSQDAREIMKKYKIGTLPANEQHLASVSCPKLCPTCSATSCHRLAKVKVRESPSSKSWRSFDQSSGSRSPSKAPSAHKVPSVHKALSLCKVPSEHKTPSPDKAPPSRNFTRRVESIIVPRESDGSGSNLKWAILALATAVVIGIALKKYLS